MILLFVLYITLCKSITLENVDWKKDPQSEVVYSMTHNEESEYKYTYVLHYTASSSSGNALKIDCLHPSISTTSISVSSSAVSRPTIAASSKKLFFLNNKNLEIFDITKATPVLDNTVSVSGIDEYSPLAVIDREFIAGKREVYAVVCKNGHLTVYNETLQLVKEYDKACGKYVSVGYDYLAVKNTSMVELYSISTGGVLTYYKWFSIGDNKTQLYDYDPMVMSQHDVVYNVLSDVGRIQVNSPSSSFSSPDYIENVKVNGNSSSITPINTLYAPMISTYGSFVAIGLFGYSEGSKERVGGVKIFFDKYLTSTGSGRFALVYNSTGSTTYGYAGYSIQMNNKVLYLGGKSELQTNGALKGVSIDISNYTSKYCIGVNCECDVGYFYSTYMRQCYPQVGQSTAIIVTVCCFLLFFIIIAIIGVLLAYYMKSKEQKKDSDDENYQHDEEVEPIVEDDEPHLDGFNA
ncbi:hypothetical protein ENUP19_0040G0036 [Entamoeba nuttalli]|uniref:Uncharacterized protein n=1 Tax=Entamoeba nuttalli TaxID=412467 RepID=A0ABQ0D9Y8_9EUKA